MKKIGLSLIGIIALISSSQAVVAETYQYTGANFNDVFAPYTTSMRVDATIVTSAPIPPNSTGLDIRPLITSFTFSDGVQTINEVNGIIHSGDTFTPAIDTDALGNITSAFITAAKTPLATAISQTDAFITIVYRPVVFIDDVTTQAVTANICTSVGAGSICNGYSGGDEFGETRGIGGGWAPVSEPTPVPTMSALGLGLLAGLIGLIGFRRRMK